MRLVPMFAIVINALPRYSQRPLEHSGRRASAPDPSYLHTIPFSLRHPSNVLATPNQPHHRARCVYCRDIDDVLHGVSRASWRSRG